jgi:Protein of unknown function (DUF3891)
MLLREVDEDAVVAIGQAAHAWLSGQIARAWGNERFGEVVPREDVCLGATQHDIGMALWDREPGFNPRTGLPCSFMEMPLPLHLELWSAAPHRVATQSRYAALLVSLHGTALYGQRDLARLEPQAAAAIRAYLAGQRDLQRELIRQLRSDPAAAPSSSDALIERNQRLVLGWDWLSLALCLRWAPTRFEGVPAADGPVAIELAPGSGADVLTLDPWPFRSERVELKTEGRLLRGRFADEASMRAAIDAAEWVTVRFALVPTVHG